MTHRPAWSWWYLAMGTFGFVVMMAVFMLDWRLALLGTVGMVLATPAFPLKMGARSFMLLSIVVMIYVFLSANNP